MTWPAFSSVERRQRTSGKGLCKSYPDRDLGARESSWVLELKCSLDQFTRHNFSSSGPCAKGTDKTCLCWHFSTSAGPASARGHARSLGFTTWNSSPGECWPLNGSGNLPESRTRDHPALPVKHCLCCSSWGRSLTPCSQGSSEAPSVSLQGSAGWEALRQPWLQWLKGR